MRQCKCLPLGRRRIRTEAVVDAVGSPVHPGIGGGRSKPIWQGRNRGNSCPAGSAMTGATPRADPASAVPLRFRHWTSVAVTCSSALTNSRDRVAGVPIRGLPCDSAQALRPPLDPRRNALPAVSARVRPVRLEALYLRVPGLATGSARAAQSRHAPAVTNRQFSVKLMRSSTGPVSFQGTLEVSTVGPDHTVRGLRGMHERASISLAPSAIIPVGYSHEPQKFHRWHSGRRVNLGRGLKGSFAAR